MLSQACVGTGLEKGSGGERRCLGKSPDTLSHRGPAAGGSAISAGSPGQLLPSLMLLLSLMQSLPFLLCYRERLLQDMLP